MILAYNHYYFSDAPRDPVIFWTIGPMIIGFIVWDFLKKWPLYWMSGLALCGTMLIYYLYPDTFVDDTGFVVRYLNNAADGCFYCFNQSEGPAFGISGFIYGIVASIVALPGLLKPEHIIIGLNFMGMAWMLFMLFKIVHHFTKHSWLTVAGVFFIIAASSKLLFSSTAGLETNFHLAIVLTAVYAFFYNKRKLFWLFLALSAISKLDTVPLVVIFGIVYLYDNRQEYLVKDSKAKWIECIKYAGIPLLIYFVLTYIMFGGPLPQSADVKLNLNEHPDDHWFPFLQILTDKGENRALIKILLAFIGLHAALGLATKSFKLRSFVVFGALLGTMALYYVYNPRERMEWYYAMPQLLFFMQLFISMIFVFKHSTRFYVPVTLMTIGAVNLAAFSLTYGERGWTNPYINLVENERIELGKYIGSITTESDSVATGHGHFGAYTDAFVIDLSGLNSEVAIKNDLNLQLGKVLTEYKPDFFIHHGNDYLIYIANELGYRLDTAAFAINEYGYPTWLLFRKNLSDTSFHYVRIQPSASGSGAMGTDKIYAQQGEKLNFDFETEQGVSKVIFGLKNVLEGDQTFKVTCGNKKISLTLKTNEIRTVALNYEGFEGKLKLSIEGPWVRTYDMILETYAR